MIPVYDYPKEVIAFVERGIFHPDEHFGEATAIGFANEREGLVAGVVYHNFSPSQQSIEISAYSSRRDWLTRPFLRKIFSYPFEELGCRVVVARCSENNKRTVRIWRAFGSEQITLPHIRAHNEGEVVSVLTREAWENSKFMRCPHGQT